MDAVLIVMANHATVVSKFIGFAGGKTQTDIAAIDDFCFDYEADIFELKGTKKKKGKKINDRFRARRPKVVQPIRQTQSRKVLWKLLTRIRKSVDEALNILGSQPSPLIVHVQGFSGLEENEDNIKIRTLAQHKKKTDARFSAPTLLDLLW
ncbi:hypothetical protein M378DRAFT_16203 [Amanita muscaria Koide BX008]|uniref:Uncharacterized protein n=1 Tax=Amanita muscaria (strain Koide BX008) TaxID=946122 RepID=A0A0C2WLI0_AMAMK|nr:hypothetical protein M378DRAFT_16203 [Amanita muscaria Koide BX008]